MSKEETAAVEFMSSMRGAIIMGQALSIAIESLEKVPLALQEKSNIADMRYILQELFPLGEAVHKGKAIAAEMSDAL